MRSTDRDQLLHAITVELNQVYAAGIGIVQELRLAQLPGNSPLSVEPEVHYRV
jgi:hypothetical protein